MRGVLRAALLATIIGTGGGAALAQGEAPAGGAVEAIQQMDAASAPPSGDPGSADVGAAWARALRDARVGAAAPDPAEGAVQTDSPSSGGMAVGLVALVVAICAGAAGYFAGRGRPSLPPPPVMPPPRMPEPEPRPMAPPAAAVGVLAVHPVEGHGDLLVVQVEDEQLVLFLGAAREDAHLLARLGAEPDGGYDLDGIAQRVVTALRLGSPALASGMAAAAVPREPTLPGAPREPGADEDLDVLLDDLLAKVRDLKPLSKSADEL